MSGLSGLAALMTVAGIGFAAVAAAASGALYPLARPWLRRCTPEARIRRLFAWAAAPALASVTLTALCLLPSLLTLGGVLYDHCFEHAATRHLCLIHPPAIPSTALPLLVVLLPGALLLVAALRLRPLLAGARVVRTLRACSRHDAARALRVVDSPLPLSLTAGLLDPQVYVSSGLTAALPADLLDAVVAHERAHAARRDTLRALLASVLAALHLPWARRAILDDLSLAIEQRCDDVAAARVGSRLAVARAIVAVERLLRGGALHAGALGHAFADRHVTARVERLLDEPPAEVPSRLGAVPLLVVAAGVALAALHPVHHLTETLLGLIIAS